MSRMSQTTVLFPQALFGGMRLTLTPSWEKSLVTSVWVYQDVFLPLAATPTAGYWHVRAVKSGRSTNYYVVVPEAEDVIDFLDLTNVDPTSYRPDARPPAVWDVALTTFLEEIDLKIADIEVGAVDPAIVEDVVEVQMNQHVNSTAPHPAYDDITDLVVLFENGLS